MLCQRCQERQASVHFTKIIGGDKTEYRLCEVCARESGDVIAKAAQAFDFNHLLSGLLNMESSSGFTTVTPATLRCESCGLSYPQFTKIGKFGCAKCYEAFESRLQPLMRRIQTGVNHQGKVPQRAGEQVKRRKNLERLRRELQQSIETEQFEHAAQLRDQIKQIDDTKG